LAAYDKGMITYNYFTENFGDL